MIQLRVKLKGGGSIEDVLGVACTEDGVLVEREDANRHVIATEVTAIEVVSL